MAHRPVIASFGRVPWERRADQYANIEARVAQLEARYGMSIYQTGYGEYLPQVGYSTVGPNGPTATVDLKAKRDSLAFLYFEFDGHHFPAATGWPDEGIWAYLRAEAVEPTPTSPVTVHERKYSRVGSTYLTLVSMAPDIYTTYDGSGDQPGKYPRGAWLIDNPALSCDPQRTMDELTVRYSLWFGARINNGAVAVNGYFKNIKLWANIV